MSLDSALSHTFCGGVGPSAVATAAAILPVNSDLGMHLDLDPQTNGSCKCADEPKADPPGTSTTLEDLQPDVLYHILVFLTQQDVAHVKMCSSRLLGSILRACQHWAPKVEAWLTADPSSVGLLQQLRGAGGRQLQPPEGVGTQHNPALNIDLPFVGNVDSSSMQAPGTKQQLAATAAAFEPSEAEGLQGSICAVRGAAANDLADSTCALSALVSVPKAVRERLDWRQVWSCLERAQQGPWSFDARRLTPAAFPHGVLLTFELLLEQPASPSEPRAREQQSGGWRDCVTVASFTLDGKTVEIMVDASGRVTSPQSDWGQGCIKLQTGQPKLLALEISYLFPVAAWFLHPCTLAAPKLQVASSNGSLHSSSTSSSYTSSSLSTTQDSSWDCYCSTASSSTSSGVSIAHSAALCSAVSSLSFTSKACSNGSSSDGTSAGIGRPRLCLDLSLGFGSYVSDPRCLDEGMRNQRPRGLERLELAHRVCWRPSKMQSWLGRLLPGIRAGSCSGSANGSSSHGSHGGNTSTTSSGLSSSCGSGSGCIVGSPSGGSRQGSSRPSFAVVVSKAAVWQVPEDPEYRFMEGFAFWAVQHKAEQLLEHYGILPPWQGRSSTARQC